MHTWTKTTYRFIDMRSCIRARGLFRLFAWEIATSKKMPWNARTPTFFPPYHCWVNVDKNAASAAKSAQTYSDDLDHWALTFLSFMKLHCSNRTQHDMNISKAKTLTFFVELAAARSGKRSTTAVPTLVWKKVHTKNAQTILRRLLLSNFLRQIYKSSWLKHILFVRPASLSWF